MFLMEFDSIEGYSDDILKEYIVSGMLFLEKGIVCLKLDDSNWTLSTNISIERFKKLKREVVIENIDDKDYLI